MTTRTKPVYESIPEARGIVFALLFVSPFWMGVAALVIRHL